jgi:hypothetical protein
MSHTIGFRWQLDDDGGGTAILFTDHQTHVDETIYHFDSLVDLPEWMADAIRKDERLRGEFPPKSKR